jgi:hypothetical protein
MRHAEFQELVSDLRRARVTTAREAVRSLLKEPRFASDPRRLELYGYRAFSQSDEDGIIAEIFRRIGVGDRRFVEIGAGDGLENNTLYLLAQGWAGAWVEGASKHVASIVKRFSRPLSTGQLHLIPAFVTRDNVNDVIEKSGITGSIDFLSIDVDGNDYFLFESLTVIRPRVVAIEFNATFRPPIKRVQQYDAAHRWNGGNSYGASLSALEELAKNRGYDLVGTGLLGINAFFVDTSLGEGHFLKATAEELYNSPAFDLIDGFGGGHPPEWRDSETLGT